VQQLSAQQGSSALVFPADTTVNGSFANPREGNFFDPTNPVYGTTFIIPASAANIGGPNNIVISAAEDPGFETTVYPGTPYFTNTLINLRVTREGLVTLTAQAPPSSSNRLLSGPYSIALASSAFDRCRLTPGFSNFTTLGVDNITITGSMQGSTVQLTAAEYFPFARNGIEMFYYASWQLEGCPSVRPSGRS
jgi:hypothetical protein